MRLICFVPEETKSPNILSGMISSPEICLGARQSARLDYRWWLGSRDSHITGIFNLPWCCVSTRAANKSVFLVIMQYGKLGGSCPIYWTGNSGAGQTYCIGGTSTVQPNSKWHLALSQPRNTDMARSEWPLASLSITLPPHVSATSLCCQGSASQH